MPATIVSADRMPSHRAKTLRLFCLPYAAGSARVFRDWHRDLPKFVDVRPLELPGHGRRSRQEPLDELDPVMADLLETVLREADRPIAIVGYDYGALLGFELARRLEHHHGIVPMRLFVAAMRAPVWPRPANPVSEMSEDRFKELLSRPAGGGDADGAAGADGDLLDIDALMDFAIRVLRADFRVADNYRYEPGSKLSCPITAFRGRDDAGVSRQSVEAWNVCTTGPFRHHEMPGGHYFLYPARELLLRRLSAELRAGALPRAAVPAH
ncbi:MAG TPA: alpha/beta fold hydrolase [Streptosporangiaceae bacterium]|nr:alpha/beta fold hydrolase [Streptosporangiaceae bacterium]